MGLRIIIPNDKYEEHLVLLKEFGKMPEDSEILDIEAKIVRVEKSIQMCRYNTQKQLDHLRDIIVWCHYRLKQIADLRTALFIVPAEQWPDGFKRQFNAGRDILSTPYWIMDV